MTIAGLDRQTWGAGFGPPPLSLPALAWSDGAARLPFGTLVSMHPSKVLKVWSVALATVCACLLAVPVPAGAKTDPVVAGPPIEFYGGIKILGGQTTEPDGTVIPL